MRDFFGALTDGMLLYERLVNIYPVIRQPDCNTIIYSINTIYQLTIRHAVTDKAVGLTKCSIRVKSITGYCFQQDIKHLMYMFC